MLALLMLLPTVFSKETAVDENFIIKRIDSCPDEGYYFRRELTPNSVTHGRCYLCFCQNDGTATCWGRQNRRCDVESYHYHNVGKRDTRIRRAIGLGDIFLRDAARDFFNKQLPEQCKPYESSFSDGCPPADWCIGCTVCDCDANGHWDCHILSYCPNKTTKKPAHKPRKGPHRRTVVRKSSKRMIKSTNKKPVKPKPKPTSTPTKKPAKKIVLYKPISNNRQKRQPVKNLNQVRNKKFIQRRSQPPRKIVKKYVVIKPVTPSTDPTKQILLPTSPKLAQTAVRKIMEAMQKMMRNDLKKGNSSKILKAVDKRRLSNSNHIKKSVTQKNKRSKSTTKKFIGVIGQKNIARNKREANFDIQDFVGINTTVPSPKETSLGIEKAEKSSNNIVALPPSFATTPISFEKTANVTLAITSSGDTHINYVALNNTGSLNTVTGGNYYKYLENVNATVLTTTNKPTVTKCSKNLISTATHQSLNNNTKTEKVRNFIISVNNIKGEREAKQDRMIYLIDRIPSGNDLKFKKWSQMKLLKDKAKHFKIELVKSKNLDNILSIGRLKTAELSGNPNQRMYSKEPVKKITVSRKYNNRKLVNTSKIGKNYKINTNKTNILYVNSKIKKLQTILKDLLKGFNGNNTSKINRKSKQFNIIRYMRKLFKKMFISRGKKIPEHDKRFLEHHHIIETLCENFGPCKINEKHRNLLNIKLKDIHSETAKILKIINIIKGLLHLIELPSNKTVKLNIEKSSLNGDILKLNSILKDTYSNENNQKPLSETQSVQIEYIKKNTQEFVQSIGKFAALLNEIIAILTETENKDDKYTHRPVSFPVETKTNREEAFTYIKKILLKYDIIHNTFVRKMYDALSIFESKLNQKERAEVNIKKELKNIASINHFSNNIITNLRKLTHLAKTLKSNRRKREATRDEDTIEYLLMLMEYLLKQNYPLDAVPVNDGIDLLLESIKHSPDIKSIKKKVLGNTSLTMVATSMSPSAVNKLTTENLSETNLKSREDDAKSEANITSKLDDAKLTEVEEDRDYDDMYVITKKSIDISTQSAVYRSKNESTTINIDVHTSTNIKYPEHKLNPKFEENKTTFDRIEERFSARDNSKKYEIYNADLDEEHQVTETSTTESTQEIPTVIDEAPLETKTKNEEDSSVSEINYKSPKLDWVDKEAKDYKEYKSLSFPKSTTTTTTEATTTHKATEDNVSIISRETKTEDKRKKSSINIKEVMLKKQMDLLNSLDYGTERTNIEDESKEDVADDRYSVDTFPVYFV